MESKNILASSIKTLAEDAIKGVEASILKIRELKIEEMCRKDPNLICRFIRFLLGIKIYTKEQAEKEIPPEYGLIWKKEELSKINAIIALCDMSLKDGGKGQDAYLTVNSEDIEYLLEWKEKDKRHE